MVLMGVATEHHVGWRQGTIVAFEQGNVLQTTV
jgi:hypothetical protein